MYLLVDEPKLGLGGGELQLPLVLQPILEVLDVASQPLVRQAEERMLGDLLLQTFLAHQEKVDDRSLRLDVLHQADHLQRAEAGSRRLALRAEHENRADLQDADGRIFDTTEVLVDEVVALLTDSAVRQAVLGQGGGDEPG